MTKKKIPSKYKSKKEIVEMYDFDKRTSNWYNESEMFVHTHKFIDDLTFEDGVYLTWNIFIREILDHIKTSKDNPKLQNQLNWIKEETKRIILHCILKDIRVYKSYKLRNMFDVSLSLMRPSEIEEELTNG